MLEDDIKIVEDGINSWDVEQSVVDAFERIKKELVEALKPSPNTGSPKSAPEIVESVSHCPYCVHGDNWKNGGCHRESSGHSCFVGRRLRAGA